MTKKEKAKRYSLINAALAGLVCAAVALVIGYLIDEGSIKHRYDFLFAYAAVGIVISILNFKPLSKLSILFLPPTYAMSSFGIVAGPILMHYLGFDKSNLGELAGIIVENVPFFIFATILYNSYSSLAGKKSFSVYSVFATITVVVSLLIFRDTYPVWMIQGVYLGIGAFLFSLLHLRQAL